MTLVEQGKAFLGCDSVNRTKAGFPGSPVSSCIWISVFLLRVFAVVCCAVKEKYKETHHVGVLKQRRNTLAFAMRKV